ncbi:MAG: transporter [Planctomycetia bacterium]|nr:transporter [Planctomycetia bacterium]
MNLAPRIRWFVAACLLLASMPAAGARAQTPALIAARMGVAAPAAEPRRPEPVPPPRVMGPPADPQPANWGDYIQPPAPPIGPLVLEYSLAAPATGIIQQNVPDQYRAPVADSESVWTRDATFLQAIDLWRPDGLAPVGVEQDATLRGGQFLFSYRFNYQAFEDNLVGTHRVSDASVAASFPFVPNQMNTGRHLLIVQYGVTDDFTIFGQLPFQHSSLDYLRTAGGTFGTGFTNPGDITLSAMYVLWRRPGQQLHLNLGLNFPVGFLDSQSDIPSPVVPNLPYVIRTGSGTYDLLPGLTYRGQNPLWSWGVQSIGTVRLGINRLDYKLGDRADLTAWIARRWGERLSTSFRIDNQWWGNVRGADPRLNTALAPTNDPQLQGGNRVDLLFGVNLFLPNTILPGQRFSIEGGAPVYQSLNGPQLGTSWLLNAGWNLVY